MEKEGGGRGTGAEDDDYVQVGTSDPSPMMYGAPPPPPAPMPMMAMAFASTAMPDIHAIQPRGENVQALMAHGAAFGGSMLSARARMAPMPVYRQAPSTKEWSESGW